MRWNIVLLALTMVSGVAIADNHPDNWMALTKDPAYMAALRAKVAMRDSAAQKEMDLRIESWLALTKDTAYMATLRSEATQGNGIAQEEMVLRTRDQESWDWLQRCAQSRGACALWMSNTYRTRSVTHPRASTFVEPDPLKALEWSKRAAALGNTDGMLSVASMLKDPDSYGSRWPRDLALAKKYYIQAYEAGDPYGAIEMGIIAMDPKLGGPDFAQAELWYKRAGAKGESYLAYVNRRKAEADNASKTQRSAGPFPPRPLKRQGVVSCATKCNNADCYRTYDDGRQVHFQAQQKWNPFENRFEFDSGGC